MLAYRKRLMSPNASASRGYEGAGRCDQLRLCSWLGESHGGLAGGDIQSRTTLQEFDVVTELEKKYIFFGDEADIARKLIVRGRSCVLSVYFREP